MSSIYSWSETADDNDDADVAINWQESQQPDTVNNSARAMMGRVAEYVADQGTQTVGGTANAMTLTANSGFTAYANGLRLTIKAASTNTTAVNLNVNSLGNKALRKVFRGAVDVALGAGDIQEGGVYQLIYDAAANSAAGAWIVTNPALSAVATGDTVAIANGGTGQITAALAMDALGATRTITAGTGLTGGGTLAANRTIALSSPVAIGNGGTGATSAADARDALGVPPNGRLVSAGNGLTGGGSLSADRTITLGTPTSLSTTTTNSVSGTTHSHALEGVAGLTTTNDNGETDFPLGHVIVVIGTSAIARNGSIAACLHTTNRYYTIVGEDGDSTALEGTWRSRGGMLSLNHILCQRVA